MYKKLAILLTTLCCFASYGEAAMSLEQAKAYQIENKKEIRYVQEDTTDANGIEGRCHLIGLIDSKTIRTTKKDKDINIVINYGINGDTPFTYIRYTAYLKGALDDGYNPDTVIIKFEDGYQKELYNFKYCTDPKKLDQNLTIGGRYFYVQIFL